MPTGAPTCAAALARWATRAIPRTDATRRFRALTRARPRARGTQSGSSDYPDRQVVVLCGGSRWPSMIGPLALLAITPRGAFVRNREQLSWRALRHVALFGRLELETEALHL